MQPKPFTLRYELEGPPFALLFLAADDFTVYRLKDICRDLGVSSSGTKSDLISQIDPFLDESPHETGMIILRSMVRRKKKWLTFRTGTVRTRPELLDPVTFVYSEGDPAWYGPIQDPYETTTSWYFRLLFPSHWEINGDPPEPKHYRIRWICSARVSRGVVSLHWQGFSVGSDRSRIGRNSQFPYWSYVPGFFDELETILETSLEKPNLHDLVLHRLWEEFRLDDRFAWTDLRIRAESGGVSLSARSSTSTVDLDIRGINHLARTLRRSVNRELARDDLEIPSQERMDEAILRTLIREFGAKSYQFSLESEQDKIFKAHVYFGMKPDTPTPDSFGHINCFTSWRHPVAQLQFLLQYLS